MKRKYKWLAVSCLLAGVLSGAPLLPAADSTANARDQAAGRAKGPAAKAKANRDWYPFGGIVASVDTRANTVSLKRKSGERVLRLDAKSTLEINGKPATLSSVKVGDYAHGKLHKDSAGHEVITAAKFDKERPQKRQAGGGNASATTPTVKSKKQSP